MPKDKVEAQLSMLNSLFSQSNREEILIDHLLLSMKNIDWLMWCGDFVSDVDQKDKTPLREYSYNTLLWTMDLILALSRHTLKYRRLTVGELKTMITPENAYLGRTEPLSPHTLYEYYVGHESRLNGLLLAFKDILRPHEDKTVTLTTNLRNCTLQLHKYVTSYQN